MLRIMFNPLQEQIHFILSLLCNSAKRVLYIAIRENTLHTEKNVIDNTFLIEHRKSEVSTVISLRNIKIKPRSLY